MQQRCRDRVGIEADLGHDLGHGQRVDDIRLSGLAELVLMLFVGVFVCPLNDLQISGGRITAIACIMDS